MKRGGNTIDRLAVHVASNTEQREETHNNRSGRNHKNQDAVPQGRLGGRPGGCRVAIAKSAALSKSR